MENRRPRPQLTKSRGLPTPVVSFRVALLTVEDVAAEPLTSADGADWWPPACDPGAVR